MNLRTFSILVAILFAYQTPVLFATDVKTEFTKKISREFSTTPDGTTALYNKYGKVEVKTWSENKVKINVNIVVVANNESEANKTFDRINVNFMSTYGYVKAETMISNSSSSSWNFSWDGFWGNNHCAQDYKINYEVYMPPANNLDLKNSYGNSYLASYNGKLTAEIKYGDIKSTDMSNDVDLVLAYGNGTFNSLRDLKLDVSYGKLDLEYAKNVSAETKYSELDYFNVGDLRIVSMYDEIAVGTANTMKVQTKYSDLKLGKIQNLYLTSQYTDTKVDQLGQNIDADLNYGDLTIASLHDKFQSVKFNGNYADLKIVPFSAGQGYSFDLQGNYSDLEVPSRAAVTTDKSARGKQVKGNMNGGGGTIKAKVNYGDILITN
jgi:hypothetical protein